MKFIKNFKGVIIATGIVVILLAISLYSPPSQNIITTESIIEDVVTETEEYAKPEANETTRPVIIPEVPEPDTKEQPYEEVIETVTLSCSLEIKCDTLFNNMDRISPEKIPLIPENGLILPETEFEFAEGETAFDVLERELKRRKIHFEFTNVPMYDSVYIEGIGNLYEFDAGPLSGWIYRVNGNVLSVGCSQYKLKRGDKLEFLYTCNMGKDL